jgi:hypothetical protein
MKIKYRLPNKKHDTCLTVGHLTIGQFSAIIDFLKFQGVENYEYIHKG